MRSRFGRVIAGIFVGHEKDLLVFKIGISHVKNLSDVVVYLLRFA